MHIHYYSCMLLDIMHCGHRKEHFATVEYKRRYHRFSSTRVLRAGVPNPRRCQPCSWCYVSRRFHAEVGQIIDASFERQPLYIILWHALYSISDIAELRNTLSNKLGIADETVLDALCKIDFVKSGYGNKSSRAIRKILPYLQQGVQYYEAKLAAGYDDTPLNKEQNEARVLADALVPIQRGELRQPVVEKILNQFVNVVNALMKEYGRFNLFVVLYSDSTSNHNPWALFVLIFG